MFGRLLFVDLASGRLRDRLVSGEGVSRFLGGKGSASPCSMNWPRKGWVPWTRATLYAFSRDP